MKSWDVTKKLPGLAGSTALLGGLPCRTVFGVLPVPGLYSIFGSLAEGKSLIREEAERTVTLEATHYV